MLQISGAAVSDVGLVRENNEDAAYLSPSCALVADGVGGGAAGEIASATAAHAVVSMVLQRVGEDPAQVLTDGFALAQEQVRAGVAQHEERRGMATTMTAVLTDGSRFVLAHLGDSRGFVLRDGVLTQVTQDHTYVQNLLDTGLLPTDEAGVHPFRNIVLRSVNGRTDGEPDLTELRLVPGDRILLASDGLTDLVAEDEITALLQARTDADAVHALLDAALAEGGRDNITCVLATVVERTGEVGVRGEAHGALREQDNVVGTAVLWEDEPHG